MSKRLTIKEFIEKSKEVHGNYFDYSLVEYINNNTEVKIICPIHGIFKQLPRTHSSGTGCKQCKFDSYKTKEDEIIKQFIKFHGDKYNYSGVEYFGAHSKVKIICPIHGEFEQTPEKHKKGMGCKKCGIDKLTLSTQNVINQFNKIHNFNYDYSKVKYERNHQPVIIICKKHGEFKQSPHNHKKGKGCPICNESSGERNVRNWLINNNINFTSQKSFEDCISDKKLRFDFYLPEYNTCIEYNGIQHYREVQIFKGKKGLESTKKRDKIKAEYCKNNGIQLLIIKYDQNIEDILSSIFLAI